MLTSQEAIARSAAEHFAPELGAALSPITERLLEGEEPDDPITRSLKLRDLVNCAAYLVELSAIAIDLHHQLVLQRAEQAGESPGAMVESLRTLLRSKAPRDALVADHLRERMVTTVADVTLERPRLLPHATILAVQRAAVALGPLPRPALLAGIDPTFIAGLLLAPTLDAQLLCDLDQMSSTGTLTDGSMPLARWLDNAVFLAGPRREGQVFVEARARLKARQTP
jgi:hypothetical protein